MDTMIRLTEEQAEIYIPLHEDFTGATIEDCDYFYLAPSERGEGWEKVIYYTGRRWKDIASDTEGSQHIYVLSNKSMPGIYKIGFTKGDPKKRAKQISSSTGVPQPFEVEFSFKCFNGLQLEGEIHNYLKKYQINKRREFFQMKKEEAVEAIKLLGERYQG